MSTKDISDELVCKAVNEYYLSRSRGADSVWPYVLLSQWTQQPEKVCFRAMERCCKHGHLEYGVSLRTAWLTESGYALLKNAS